MDDEQTAALVHQEAIGPSATNFSLASVTIGFECDDGRDGRLGKIAGLCRPKERSVLFFRAWIAGTTRHNPELGITSPEWADAVVLVITTKTDRLSGSGRYAPTALPKADAPKRRA